MTNYQTVAHTNNLLSSTCSKWKPLFLGSPFCVVPGWHEKEGKQHLRASKLPLDEMTDQPEEQVLLQAVLAPSCPAVLPVQHRC